MEKINSFLDTSDVQNKMSTKMSKRSIVVFPRDVWLYCIAPILSPLDISRLRSICPTLRRYFRSHKSTNELIEYSRSKSADFCMAKSALYGYLDCVNFFISKGADDWNEGMIGASKGGHLSLVEYFMSKKWRLSKTVRTMNALMAVAAEGGHLPIVEYFISKGADDWDWGMFGAAKGGHLSLVEYFISKGANDWNEGLIRSASGGSFELVKYFISKGSKYYFGEALREATYENHTDIVVFLKEIMN